MARDYRLDGCDGLVYYGNSDFLAQIADHFQRYPDSCLTKNVVAAYTSLYSEVYNPDTCDYQVEINEKLCPEPAIDNEGIAIDLLLDFLEGQPRRVARRAINRIRRKVLREIVQNTAPDIGG